MQRKVAKYTSRPLPGQLPLPLTEPATANHDPSGLTRAGLAEWILARSAGKTSKAERTFLYGVVIGLPMSPEDVAQLDALHRRIGGRGLPPSPDLKR